MNLPFVISLDLIMIELQLPIVSGFGAIRRIKKANDLSHVPIIAISSTNPTNNNNLAMACPLVLCWHRINAARFTIVPSF